MSMTYISLVILSLMRFIEQKNYLGLVPVILLLALYTRAILKKHPNFLLKITLITVSFQNLHELLLTDIWSRLLIGGQTIPLSSFYSCFVLLLVFASVNSINELYLVLPARFWMITVSIIVIILVPMSVRMIWLEDYSIIIQLLKYLIILLGVSVFHRNRFVKYTSVN